MQNLTFSMVRNIQKRNTDRFIFRKKHFIIYHIYIIKQKSVKTTSKNRKITDELISNLKYICTIEKSGMLKTEKSKQRKFFKN